ncbi:MAG TPA: glycoside hydrolase family 28 protein [Bryobacterales bacterium]|nr:glycoside hydrolase family 28 protein [Bryobacterales bacterium]
MKTAALLLPLFLLAVTANLSAAAFLDVRALGAKGDGSAKDTAAVQRTIDAAAQQGGGVVVFPAGTYLCGTIHLKSHVTLYLSPGATIAESPDNADFDPPEKLDYDSHADTETTYFHYALLAGEDVESITIEGAGTIDGNRTRRHGPKPIALKRCRHVTIRGVTVKNSPNYAVSFLGCDYVVVDGVTVLNSYADGIDPDSSRYVRISNCFVDSSDDAICPKTSLALGHPRSTEHLVVTNCNLSTSSNNFKLGTESSGDFKDIAFSNCVMFRRERNAARDLAGIALESVDGSHIEGVVISNVSMQGIFCPIFIRLGNRGRGLNPPKPGSIENVTISSVVAAGSQMTSSITGLAGAPVRHLVLDNIQLAVQGGGQPGKGLDVPEAEAKYPESKMFGELPSYGLYVRHVEGLTLRNVQTRWLSSDPRPAMIFDDVKDLDIGGFATDTVAGSEPLLWFHKVVGAFLHGSRAPVSMPRFLRLTETAKDQVRLADNDTR